MKFILILQCGNSNPKGYINGWGIYNTLEEAQQESENWAEDHLEWPKGFYDGQMTTTHSQNEPNFPDLLEYYTICRMREYGE